MYLCLFSAEPSLSFITHLVHRVHTHTYFMLNCPICYRVPAKSGEGETCSFSRNLLDIVKGNYGTYFTCVKRENTCCLINLRWRNLQVKGCARKYPRGMVGGGRTACTIILRISVGTQVPCVSRGAIQASHTTSTSPRMPFWFRTPIFRTKELW